MEERRKEAAQGACFFLSSLFPLPSPAKTTGLTRKARRFALPALRLPPCALPASRLALRACRRAFRLLSGGFLGTHLSAMCMRRNKRHAEFEFRATVHSLPSGSARHWQRALLALLGAVALAALSSCKKSPPRDSA